MTMNIEQTEATIITKLDIVVGNPIEPVLFLTPDNKLFHRGKFIIESKEVADAIKDAIETIQHNINRHL